MDYMKPLIESAAHTKKQAQALGNFLKTGKAKQYVDMCFAMKGENVEVYAYTWTLSIQISVYVKELEGFVDPRLAGVLQQMEYLNPRNTSMSESAAQLTKTFTYTFDAPRDEATGFKPTVAICVYASVKDDSETCKRVVIGMTDAKPEPIYKIVCEGQDDPTLAPPSEVLNIVGGGNANQS